MELQFEKYHLTKSVNAVNPRVHPIGDGKP